jgi:hypothetical protein
MNKEQQAFPTLSSTNDILMDGTERHAQTHYSNPGMTLRDWFAGQALAGNLASVPPDADPDAEAMARFSYRVADAMLAAREGKS